MSVYVPIGFQGGLTGTLFREFAITLAGAVSISAIVALTLSPMLASRWLKPHKKVIRLLNHWAGIRQQKIVAVSSELGNQLKSD